MSTAHPGKAAYQRDPAPDPAWARRGACAGHPEPDLWFSRADDEPRQQRAVAICRACPVQAPCLHYAMSVPDLAGIWAGTTRNQRTRLRNKAAKTAPAKPAA